VVEGAVLHHQDDDVFQVIEAGRRHIHPHWSSGNELMLN
jgi:hypothetical protein